MTKDLEEFIESLHIGCICVSVDTSIDSDDENAVRESCVNYLHQCLATLTNLTDEKRGIIDRMAERIAKEGLDLEYKTYR